MTHVQIAKEKTDFLNYLISLYENKEEKDKTKAEK